ncbi:methionine adenosyltransferase domain-containing protein [Candidatus Woesearchaeota archaeon]|nr:methionine adenosyltransferase domain-containing protein [Candidatus Woesearchaeota archaeon]
MSDLVMHSFEAGRRGKPDELESQLANLIGAYFLEIDNNSRFDLRVCGGISNSRPVVRVSGEVTESLIRPGLKEDLTGIIAAHYNKIHLTRHDPEFFVLETSLVKPQSFKLHSNGHAGDSGNPIAAAYSDSPLNLPWERYLAVSIRNIIDDIFQGGGNIPEYVKTTSGRSIEGLLADGKVGVDVIYEGAKIRGVNGITIAVQHEEHLKISDLRKKLENVVFSYLNLLGDAYKVDFGVPSVVINGLGDWNVGGWQVDEGSREAKPYRDGFASYGVVEDSFTGEDPSKPSGTGTIIAWNIARQIMKNGLADFARVMLGYRIGREDVIVNVYTGNSAKISQDSIHEWVNDNFQLRLSDAVRVFGMKSPEIYRSIAEASDYFHSRSFPWNRYSLERRLTG